MYRDLPVTFRLDCLYQQSEVYTARDFRGRDPCGVLDLALKGKESVDRISYDLQPSGTGTRLTRSSELTRLDHFYLRAQDCALKNEQAAKLNSRVDDSHVQIYARICVVAALVCIGDLEEAQCHSEAMLNMAERTRYHSELLTSLWMQTFVHLYKGDWESVREATDLGLALNPPQPRSSDGTAGF